jgi:hypothetical protein
MHPDEETLVRLALGEPGGAADAAHAAGCASCQAFIAELTETLALVGEASGEELVAPPDSVWRAISAQVAAEDQPPLVPASAPAASGPVDELAARRRPRFGWLAVAAAVGVVAGVVGTQVVPPLVSPPPQVIAQAQLDTLDTGTRGGEAELLASHGLSLDLRVQVKPLDAGTGYLEVWLINSDLKRMVSVGVLPSDATEQDFQVTRSLIDQGYVIVDISREQFDDRPQHSGDSLLRGSLA